MAENEQTKVCPKCGKQMEVGYIPDRVNLVNYVANFSVWVSGQPEKSFLGGLDLDGKTTLNVTSYRCQTCGYLESYAQNK
jgi:predicted nucleic-acid-binding Zn-ribbon protein